MSMKPCASRKSRTRCVDPVPQAQSLLHARRGAGRGSDSLQAQVLVRRPRRDETAASRTRSAPRARARAPRSRRVARFGLTVPSGRSRTTRRHREHVFAAHALGARRSSCAVRIERRPAGCPAITQIEEDHAAVVAAAMDPAGNGDLLCRSASVHVTAVMSAHVPQGWSATAGPGRVHGPGRAAECTDAPVRRKAPTARAQRYFSFWQRSS